MSTMLRSSSSNNMCFIFHERTVHRNPSLPIRAGGCSGQFAFGWLASQPLAPWGDPASSASIDGYCRGHRQSQNWPNARNTGALPSVGSAPCRGSVRSVQHGPRTSTPQSLLMSEMRPLGCMTLCAHKRRGYSRSGRRMDSTVSSLSGLYECAPRKIAHGGGGSQLAFGLAGQLWRCL